MKNFLWAGLAGLILCCFSACNVGKETTVDVSDADSIYHMSKILKIAFQQPELALKRMDTCEMKGINNVDSIRFYRGTLQGLLKNSDQMFAEWDKILFREGADVGSSFYLHVLKSAASMKNNRNQKVKALEYCLLGDSLAIAHGNTLASIQFKGLAANISNECFVQKDNIAILEKCVEDSRSLLDSKRNFNINLFFREDLYDAYCRYNPFASDEDKKDNLFLYNFACETKTILDQMREKHYGGTSNEALDYKYIQCYSQMVENLVKMGRKEEARTIFEEKAKPLCLEASQIMRTASNMASMQAVLGDFDASIDFFTQDLESNKTQKDTVNMMVDLNNLRDCYERMGDFEHAYQSLNLYHDLYKWKARKDFLGQSNEYLSLFKVQEHQAAQHKAEAEAHVLQVFSTVITTTLILIVCLLGLLWRQYHTIQKLNRTLVANINKVIDDNKQEKRIKVSNPATYSEYEEQMVQRYIHELCSRNLFCNPNFDRDELLEELHFPKTGFWKLFEEKTGQRFATYILNLRLEYAAEMIREHPEYTIDGIATKSGFSGRSTFYRNFTARFGISPNIYRVELGQ